MMLTMIYNQQNNKKRYMRRIILLYVSIIVLSLLAMIIKVYSVEKPYKIIDTKRPDDISAMNQNYDDIYMNLNKTNTNITTANDNISAVSLSSSTLIVSTHTQNDTTDSIVFNQSIRKGWGYIQGNNTDNITKAVTYGMTYDDKPIIIATLLGYKDTSAPTTIDELSTTYTFAAGIIVLTPTVTGFTVSMEAEGGSSFINSKYYGFSWLSIGTKK